MSHFTVMVVGDNIEEHLHPFCEDTEHLDVKLLEFEDSEDEYLNDYNTKSMDMIKVPTHIAEIANTDREYHGHTDGQQGCLSGTFNHVFRTKKHGMLVYSSDSAFSITEDLNKPNYHTRKDPPEEFERIDVKPSDLWDTFEEYVKDYCGQESRDEIKEKFGYWHNPNAKWDWYQVGGRWAGYWKLKKGKKGQNGSPSLLSAPDSTRYKGHTDSVRKKDIDFDGMYLEAYEKAKASWPKIEEAREKGDAVSLQFMYGVDPEDTEESYCARAQNAAVGTFALLHEGQWYEKGSMGWWGIVTDEIDPGEWHEEMKELLAQYPNHLAVAVDCHV
jgi:hypothetical protein